MNSTRKTTNGELRAMVHEVFDSGDSARIQRDYWHMDNQELTEAKITEIFDPDIQEGLQR